jgi:predicted RNA binding protein YcfA (HicA-like mRNA interferase family)
MATNYVRGRAFEYRIKDFLEQKGYEVFRTAGSHSRFDLIAVKKPFILFLQLKHKKLSPNLLTKLLESIWDLNSQPLVSYSFIVTSKDDLEQDLSVIEQVRNDIKSEIRI